MYSKFSLEPRRATTTTKKNRYTRREKEIKRRAHLPSNTRDTPRAARRVYKAREETKTREKEGREKKAPHTREYVYSGETPRERHTRRIRDLAYAHERRYVYIMRVRLAPAKIARNAARARVLHADIGSASSPVARLIARPVPTLCVYTDPV